MHGTRAFIAFLASVAAVALGAAPAGAQDQSPIAVHAPRTGLTDENFYFVMADRFENGTTANDTGGLGDDPMVSGLDPTNKGFYHGGDLQGIRARLPYIKGLGTTAIWLTPSFKNLAVQPLDKSAGYHGYWITDFTQIDPHLGTNADLAALIADAHKLGMKVFFDIITNHTADVIGYREGQRMPYVSKDRSPYREAATGTPFDDREYAGTDAFPALDPETSFPYHPIVPDGAPRKVPDWLNVVTLYHNRGDTTFTGEDSQYGDFFGLDDLFTENPRVVRGMIDIYEGWIRDFGIDGFRIDTMKHVNDEFWQQFGPEVLAYAREHGVPDFFMFGEVADSTRPLTSHYTTTDRMQSVLDFPFQAAAQAYAASNGSAATLAQFFRDDDWYTDADSNVYELPTFLGNHDMGRIGRFIRLGEPTASDAEVLARDRLAHALMYFSRGNPVVYYGDEQGFTGDGGDQDARQDMFPSRVASYDDDEMIGTDATTAQSNFDPSHPLYRTIADLAKATREHPALRDGAEQVRYASDGPGIYAFSRTRRMQQREYLVAVNNAETAQQAGVPTYATRAGKAFERVWGSGPRRVRTTAGGTLPVSVPALSAVVYEGATPVARSKAAPYLELREPGADGALRDRAEIRADTGDPGLYEVTFQARVGDGPWGRIGTDDSAPYRVFHDVSALDPGTSVRYRAAVLDNAGHRRRSGTVRGVVAPPAITIVAPADGSQVRDRADIGVAVTPDRTAWSVTVERRIAGGDWTAIGTDASMPEYHVVDDFAALGLATGTAIQYRATVGGAGGNWTSELRSVTVAPPPLTTAVVHYQRPNGDYDSWGLHLWGDAVGDSVLATVAWDRPFPITRMDDWGAVYEIPLKSDTAPVNFIVHQPSGDQVPETREPGGDRSFVPLDAPEIWLRAGDPTIYTSQPQ